MQLNFRRHTLQNGLRLIIHEDNTTPLISFKLVYCVGSRDEKPEQTGIAHLLEHLMFSGSRNIPSNDSHLQKVGAVINAYTSQDITEYFMLLPANNLETALWFESDRMMEPAFSPEQFRIQKQVVIEEFKERYLNKPFGDRDMLFFDFVYEKHPYKWLPIGKNIHDIEALTVDDVKDFFYQYYRPDNAVLVIAGNIHSDEVIQSVEKWFADIPPGKPVDKKYPQEDIQQKSKFMESFRDVPHDYLMKAWKICDSKSRDFYAYNLLLDIFNSGSSSILHQKFVNDNNVFSDISCRITSGFDPGLFIITGKPVNGIDIEKADALLSDFLFNFRYDDTFAHNLQKVKNMTLAYFMRGRIKIEDRASFFAVSESLSKVEDFLNENEMIENVTEDEIIKLTEEMFREYKTNTFFYRCLSHSG